MKKLLAIGMILLSTSAWAEWVEISKTLNGDIFYVDPTTLKTGGRSRVWGFAKYAQKTASGTRSNQALYEADCSEGMVRELNQIFYSDQDGRNVTFSSSDPTTWVYPPPKSAYAVMFVFLCGKAP